MSSMASYLLGITPQQVDGVNPPDGAAANGTSTAVGASSTAATELPKAAVGAANHGLSSNTTPSRYGRKYVLTAINTGLCIRFGPSGVGAATAADFYLSPGVPYMYTRPKGVTHWRAIAEDATTTTGKLKISINEWETDLTS